MRSAISKSGGNASLAGGERKVWRRLHGHEGVLIHPPHQGVCGRHGTEERRVTSGGLAASPGGTGGSGPISEREVASDALSVVGRLNSTLHVARATWPDEYRRGRSEQFLE